MTSPTVSIVLTTYNRAYILPKAVKSVLASTYRDFELIIVDDGSIDNTKEVVESFDDERIRYIKHEQNQGLAISRNTGLREARGKFLAFQDSDDEWVPRKLELQVPLLEEAPPRVGIVYMRLEKKMRNKSIVLVPEKSFTPTSGDLYRKMLEGNFITMQVALVRRECFEQIGYFDENLNWLEDWDFWLRISRAYEFLFIPEVGVRAEIMGDSLTSNQGRRLDARRKTFDKHKEEFRVFPDIFAKQSYRIGHAYALRGDKKMAYPYMWDAARTQYRLRYVIAFLLIQLPVSWYRFFGRFFGRVRRVSHS